MQAERNVRLDLCMSAPVRWHFSLYCRAAFLSATGNAFRIVRQEQQRNCRTIYRLRHYAERTKGTAAIYLARLLRRKKFVGLREIVAVNAAMHVK